MGAKQGVEIIVEAARLLAHRPDLIFMICGDGGALPDLMARAAGLSNVRFLPLQPRSELNDLLSAADIHLLPQKTTAQDLVMPSKLLGMAASGRPVIATVNPDTEIANTLAGFGAGFGIVTPPGDASALAAAIECLAGNPIERLRLGSAARQYAVDHLSREKILLRFEIELIQLSG
jgi:colanic acid biosynthesis glycosyl transferase WcaI